MGDDRPGLPDPNAYEVVYADAGYQAADAAARAVMRALEPAVAMTRTVRWPGGSGTFAPLDGEYDYAALLVDPVPAALLAGLVDLWVSGGPWAADRDDAPSVVLTAVPEPDWSAALAGLRRAVLHDARAARSL